MFTGIVEAIGVVESTQGKRISVRTPWSAQEISLGQSISVHGCCLTVVDIQNQILSFDLSDETLEKTFFANVKPNQKLNLERAMSANSRFDGHMVTGHVDTKAKIDKITLSPDQSNKVFTITGLGSNKFNLVSKGSIAIDGVSLTVNDVLEDGVSVSIIPYTFEHTCFSTLKENDSVHVEFDLIGKYLVKYLENYQLQAKGTTC
jgi:riboflavin synthase